MEFTTPAPVYLPLMDNAPAPSAEFMEHLAQVWHTHFHGAPEGYPSNCVCSHCKLYVSIAVNSHVHEISTEMLAERDARQANTDQRGSLLDEVVKLLPENVRASFEKARATGNIAFLDPADLFGSKN